jgi:hypothetical protein
MPFLKPIHKAITAYYDANQGISQPGEKGGHNAMLPSKAMVVTAIGLFVATLFARSANTATAEPGGESLVYAGRVLDPDGKPLAGAKVLISGLTPGVIEFRERAVTGADGTFRFVVRREEFGENPPGRPPPERWVFIGALADKCGAAGAFAGKPEERESLVIWLPAEEIAHGRIMDRDGKPVGGVRVQASLRSGRADKNHKPLPFNAPPEAGQPAADTAPFDEARHVAVSDKDGQVTLRGLSRDWLYYLRISGPTIVNVSAQLVARPADATEVDAAGLWKQEKGPPRLMRYGSIFAITVEPCKPIYGVVREKGSGKPVADARVANPFERDDEPVAMATTDKDGKYRLIGLPPGIHTIAVHPPPNSPYLVTEMTVNAAGVGLDPIGQDVELERQPAVTGQLTDAATGKPLRGRVEYRPLAKNPNLKDNPKLAEPWYMRSHPPQSIADKEGRFMVPVLPGPGVLLVTAFEECLPAQLAVADRVAGIADSEDPELLDCRPRPAWPAEFHGYRLIDAQPGKDAEVAIALQRGCVRPLIVEYPDGKTRDTMAFGLKPVARDRGEQYIAGRSAVAGLAENEERRLFLSTYDGQLAAAAIVNGKDVSPVTVKLLPTGTITGRIVGKDGTPLDWVHFQLYFDDGPGRPGVFVHTSGGIRALTETEIKRVKRTQAFALPGNGVFVSLGDKTDSQGRFRISGLLPNVEFDLNARLSAPPNENGQRLLRSEVIVARPTVKPGETLDLGDLKAEARAKN